VRERAGLVLAAADRVLRLGAAQRRAEIDQRQRAGERRLGIGRAPPRLVALTRRPGTPTRDPATDVRAVVGGHLTGV
jgi:hypothetical protein